ncbi:hypothetical protein VCSRO147_0646 [Vibrio cholerae]|nr:hypothetical protein VCSRO147_0646 [Vibrio cholerae]
MTETIIKIKSADMRSERLAEQDQNKAGDFIYLCHFDRDGFEVTLVCEVLKDFFISEQLEIWAKSNAIMSCNEYQVINGKVSFEDHLVNVGLVRNLNAKEIHIGSLEGTSFGVRY